MKTKLYTLLVLFVGCASWASAAELNYTKSAAQLSYTKSRKATKKASRFVNNGTINRAINAPPATSGLKKRFNGQASVIIGDNHFKAHPNVVEAHGRTKFRSHGQVWLGPLGGDGVFLGPLGGDGVFTTILDRMMTGELSNVGKLNEDFNIVLAPGDLGSMQEQALKTGDVEVLGLLIIMFRQVDELFWWTLDGSNL